ncbi:hypothetical protein AB1N83_012532, partial [Pleurotus pulmonarius]
MRIHIRTCVLVANPDAPVTATPQPPPHSPLFPPPVFHAGPRAPSRPMLIASHRTHRATAFGALPCSQGESAWDARVPSSLLLDFALVVQLLTSLLVVVALVASSESSSSAALWSALRPTPTWVQDLARGATCPLSTTLAVHRFAVLAGDDARVVDAGIGGFVCKYAFDVRVAGLRDVGRGRRRRAGVRAGPWWTTVEGLGALACRQCTTPSSPGVAAEAGEKEHSSMSTCRRCAHGPSMGSSSAAAQIFVYAYMPPLRWTMESLVGGGAGRRGRSWPGVVEVRGSRIDGGSVVVERADVVGRGTGPLTSHSMVVCGGRRSFGELSGDRHGGGMHAKAVEGARDAQCCLLRYQGGRLGFG